MMKDSQLHKVHYRNLQRDRESVKVKKRRRRRFHLKGCLFFVPLSLFSPFPPLLSFLSLFLSKPNDLGMPLDLLESRSCRCGEERFSPRGGGGTGGKRVSVFFSPSSSSTSRWQRGGNRGSFPFSLLFSVPPLNAQATASSATIHTRSKESAMTEKRSGFIVFFGGVSGRSYRRKSKRLREKKRR